MTEKKIIDIIDALLQDCEDMRESIKSMVQELDDMQKILSKEQAELEEI